LNPKTKTLTKHNGLHLKSEAKYFFDFNSTTDLEKIADFAKNKDKKIQIIGSGTNAIFPEYFSDIVIKSNNNDFSLNDEGDRVNLVVGAAVVWDDLIDFCVNKSLFGLGNLAGIPGTVGAAPVQNIGAYGEEISNFVTHVECFDLDTLKTIKLTKSDCKFDYRKSIFQESNNLIILSVGLSLLKEFKPKLHYQDLKNNSFRDENELVQTVRNIRNKKIPDPIDFPNLGSFFKNPTISKEEHEKNPKLHELKSYDLDNGDIKLSAGEMLEKLGLKGLQLRNIGLSNMHALILINNGMCTASDVRHVENYLLNIVSNSYGIKLEREPIYL
tara:strand:- start:1579 stop:2562 length:984 start_codon:yes stop_codon:yes gene_type:complete